MSIRLNQLKRPLALLLAFCLTLSLVVTGFSVPVSAADEIEGDETANYLKVPISSAEELKSAMAGSSYDGEEYSDYDGVKLELQNDITMSSANAVTVWSYNFVIDGDKGTKDAEGNMERYTLTADASSDFSFKMFAPGSNASNSTILTFSNMEIDVNGQYFFYSNGGYLYRSTINLNNVKLKNMRSTGTTTSNVAICLYGNSSSPIGAVNFNGVTTEDCSGFLMVYKEVKAITIKDSNLHTGTNASGTGYNCVIYAVAPGSASTGQTLTVTGDSTISWDDGAVKRAGIVEMGNNTIILEEGAKIGGATDDGMPAVEENTNTTVLRLGDCTIQNADGSGSQIAVANKDATLQITGKVQGEPVISLTNGASIQLSEGWQGPLKYEFTSSIANTEKQLVAKGTGSEGDDDYYPLSETDLAQLIYNDEDSVRTLQINEEDGWAYLCRTDMADCDVTLDTADAEGTYEGENGTGPIFQRNENDGALEPEVTVTLGSKTLSAENYTVKYEGTTTVPKGTDRTTILNAWATVTPAGDLTGDSVTRPYYIEVSTTYELTSDNTETVLTYENGTYSTKVTYNGQALTEDKDYTVVYRIDGDSYTVTATITGAGNYVGSYELTFDLPGKRTVKNETELNQALEQKVAYIEFGDDIDDLTGPVVVDYDVVIDGAGYTLSPDEMANDLNSTSDYAVLSVSSGNVVVTDLTVDGNYQARLLYVGSEADVTATGSTLEHGGLGVAHGNQVLPRRGMTAYIEESGTLTLDGCVVRDGGEAYPPIYNMGEMNIQNETYLTNLPSLTAYNFAINNIGTLNWTSGTFDTNLADNYTNHIMNDDAEGTGTVIQNQGIFNMSGTAKLNGYLLDENGQHTDEQSQVCTGAVHVTKTGEFNLSGDAVITGFQSIGFGSGFVTNLPSGGGGVYNNGIFNMSGGTITGNSTESAGGGVYNASVFNMTGGEITDNTAAIGGGIYNDYARDYSREKSSYVGGTYDAGELYMSGGIVFDNHLTSDTIEITGRDIGMMGGENGSIDAVGSELFVSGGCTVEISGGTIVGNTESKVAPNGDEANTEDIVKVPVGIAVVPSQNQQVMQSPDGNVVVADNASMTVTGNADIDINTGVVLVSMNRYSWPAYLKNADDGTIVQDDPDTYDYDLLVDEPILSTNDTAWLELDGNLATALKINTITANSITIDFVDQQAAGGTAGRLTTSLDGGSSINVNSDGDLVAVYKDRVTPDEDDAQWLQAGASIFLKHETRTYESEVTVYDGDDDDEGHTEMVETTLEADVWEICTHAALIEVDAKEASCSETGNIQYWYCPNCLKLFDDAEATPAHEVTEEEVTIPKTAHTVVWTDEVPATCEEDGYTEGYICDVCGAFIGFDEKTEEPAEDRIIPANGHSWIIVDEEPATATTAGHTAYVTCEVCGKNFIEPEVIPAGETSPTDKTALKVAIETAEGLTEANYTPDSWTKLQDALTAAKDVADDADALQDDVNSALTDLMKAIGELEIASTADKTALSSVISQVEEMNPEDYTPESWVVLELALLDAQKVLEDPDADQDEVNASVDALMKAIVDLEKVDSQSDEVDKTALNVAIKAAEMYTDSSAYTPESWKTLQEALNNAKTIADEDYSATKDEVETARSDLMTAIEELVKASETDKTSLSIAITAAAALDESNYTPETWAVLKAALDDAGNVLADPTADSTAVENAVNAVMAAIDGLEKVSSEEETDTSALEALVDATAAMTEKMNSSDYTTDSWNALQDALTNAKNVADNSDSTPADVAAAMEALTAALNGLKSAEESGTPEPPDETKDGFVQENGEWHYYDNGTRFTGTDIKEDTKKVVDGTDGWFYIENGKINFSCNSVEQNAYGWWYVLNGKVDFSYTGVANYSNAYGWWYISGGKVDFSKTGIEPNNYGWWRVVNGQVDFSCNSVEQNDYGWWYLVGGKVQFDYTGVANYANANGWWYVSGGKVDFSKTSIEQNNYGWWRVVGGKVDFSCNSVEQNDYGWWYVVGGKVDFSYTGVANYANAYGWWYISGGKVDFSYTGRASNNYGTWNVVNGKVVF